MAAIVVILALVGFVWGIYLALRGSLVAGCVVFLVAACCCGVELFRFDVAGVTLSADRLFLVALCSAFVVQWRLGRTQGGPLAGVDLLLLGLVALLGASALMHHRHAAGPGHVPVVQHLIGGYLIPLALYWIARRAALNERNVVAILAALACFGLYLGLTGLFEAAGWWSLVWPRYIANPEVGIHFGRARGPMVHSVSYGLYLSVCLTAAWLWRQRLARHWQVAVALVLPIFLAAIYFTKTRSVWLGAGAAFLLIVALTLRGRVRLAVLGSLCAVALVVGLTKLDAIMGLQREGTVADTRVSASMRTSFAYVSWKMFQDRPLLGCGFGQFAQAKLPYLNDRSVDLQLERIRPYEHHNTFLSLLTETGLIGLGLFLAVLAGWARSGWLLVRSTSAPVWVRRHGLLLLAALVIVACQMVFHEITFTPLDNSLLFFLAGIAVGLRRHASEALEARPATASQEPRLRLLPN